MTINNNDLEFLEEARKKFLENEHLATYRDTNGYYIALRTSGEKTRDSIEIYELGPMIEDFQGVLPEGKTLVLKEEEEAKKVTVEIDSKAKGVRRNVGMDMWELMSNGKSIPEHPAFMEKALEDLKKEKNEKPVKVEVCLDGSKLAETISEPIWIREAGEHGNITPGKRAEAGKITTGTINAQKIELHKETAAILSDIAKELQDLSDWAFISAGEAQRKYIQGLQHRILAKVEQYYKQSEMALKAIRGEGK